jgi:hypothetical protein
MATHASFTTTGVTDSAAANDYELVEFQIQHASKNYPQIPLKGSGLAGLSQFFVETVKAMGRFRKPSSGPARLLGHDYDDYNGGETTIIGIDFTPYANQADGPGLDTAASGTPLNIYLRLGSTPASALHMYNYALFERRLYITRNGLQIES